MILQTFLELVRYTVPALIIYFLMRQFYRQQFMLESTRIKGSMSSDQVGLRLQAYERFALLTERIKLSDLIIRLNGENMSAAILQNALLIAVQKEYEHNLSQQIYVSPQLWQMLELLRDETLSNITTAYAAMTDENKETYINNLFQAEAHATKAMGSKVRDAIRKEVELYFS